MAQPQKHEGSVDGSRAVSDPAQPALQAVASPLPLLDRLTPLLQRYDVHRDVTWLLHAADLLRDDPAPLWPVRQDPGLATLFHRWASEDDRIGVAFAASFALMPSPTLAHRVRFEDDPYLDDGSLAQQALRTQLLTPLPDVDDVRDRLVMDRARADLPLWSAMPSAELQGIPPGFLQDVQGYRTDGQPVGDAMVEVLTDPARWPTDGAGWDRWVQVADLLRLHGYHAGRLETRVAEVLDAGEAAPAGGVPDPVRDGWDRVIGAMQGPAATPSRPPIALDLLLAEALADPRMLDLDAPDARRALHDQVRAQVAQGADPRAIPAAVFAFRQAVDQAFEHHQASHNAAKAHAAEPDEHNEVDAGRWDGHIADAEEGMGAALDALMLGQQSLGVRVVLSGDQSWALQRFRPLMMLETQAIDPLLMDDALMRALWYHGSEDDDRPYGLVDPWPGVRAVARLVSNGTVPLTAVEALLEADRQDWPSGLKPLTERLVLEQNLLQAGLATPAPSRGRPRL